MLRDAQATAQRRGTTVLATDDAELAVGGADAVSTDTWLSMGDAESERAARAAAFAPYRVTAALMAKAARRAVFMHCLPAHRREEVAAEVIDGPASVVLDEAENRMHTAQAILVALCGGMLTGAPSPVGAG